MTNFQAPIRPADRRAAWGWLRNAEGQPLPGQPYDQHVRDELMQHDDLVLRQMAYRFMEQAIENTGGWEQF